MKDWTAGYIADIDYTYGYYTETNPSRIALAMLFAGLVPPKLETACELGFGQGVSINIHAASSPIKWIGTDFNPSQAGFAKDLAAQSGANIDLFDQSFEAFCKREDLPEFDFIALHGIWSWISDKNRQIIIDFFERKLKVGGIVYLSYNTQPGWSGMVPMRDLLTHYADVMASEGSGMIERINSALEFAESFSKVNPGFLKSNPTILDRLNSLNDKSRNYLAHEYFNQHWEPMGFAQMEALLSEAKLSYAASANYHDALDILNLTNEQQNFLKRIPDPVFRETARDFCLNQVFRRDYWVKGPRYLNEVEKKEALREIDVILMTPRNDVKLEVKGRTGLAKLNENVYNPILDLLKDHKPHKISEIENQLVKKEIQLHQIIEAVMMLVGAGVLAPANDNSTDEQLERAEKLNTALLEKSRSSNNIQVLASPVLEGGVSVGRTYQLFIHALKANKTKKKEWVDHAWDILSSQGHNIVKDGRALETDKENKAELDIYADRFQSKLMPLLKALKIL